RTPSSNACWHSVPAQPTSARRARSSGMSWPTRKATCSACSRRASTRSDALDGAFDGIGLDVTAGARATAAGVLLAVRDHLVRELTLAVVVDDPVGGALRPFGDLHQLAVGQ